MSKQRLAGILEAHERQSLALHLFDQTLARLGRYFPELSILVVTESPRIKSIALQYGVEVLTEPSESNLNAAVDLAAQWCCQNEFESQLVLPADIADLCPIELATLLHSQRLSPSVLICPASDGGTNALLTSPPDVIAFSFGSNSSRQHVQNAQQHLIPCMTLSMDKLSFDVDTPKDLQRWNQTCSDEWNRSIYNNQTGHQQLGD